MAITHHTITTMIISSRTTITTSSRTRTRRARASRTRTSKLSSKPSSKLNSKRSSRPSNKPSSKPSRTRANLIPSPIQIPSQTRVLKRTRIRSPIRILRARSPVLPQPLHRGALHHKQARLRRAVLPHKGFPLRIAALLQAETATRPPRHLVVPLRKAAPHQLGAIARHLHLRMSPHQTEVRHQEEIVAHHPRPQTIPRHKGEVPLHTGAAARLL